MLDVLLQGRRQLPEHIERAVANHGKLYVSNTAFGPCSSESPDRTLCGPSESHSCINDDVIEMAIAVEIYRQSLGMSVIVMEGPIMFILPCEFWAMNGTAFAQAPNDGTLKQLRLRENAGAGRQRGSVSTGSGERQQHGSYRAHLPRFRPLGHPDLERITSSPVKHSLRSRWLRPAVLLPPRGVFRQARQQIGRVGSNHFFSIPELLGSRFPPPLRQWKRGKGYFHLLLSPIAILFGGNRRHQGNLLVL